MWKKTIIGYKVYNTCCAQMVLATSGQIRQMLDNSIRCLKLVLTTSLFKINWQSAISSSSRFTTRRELSVACQLPEYINAIRNPDIRLIYTILRTDLNVLSTCRASKKQSRMCPMCNTESETVSHFVLHCPYFSAERNIFYDCIKPYSPYLSLNSESRKLSYILDVRCPPETIRFCCKYIESIYIRRERFALWYMWRYISICVCISICIYMCSA